MTDYDSPLVKVTVGNPLPTWLAGQPADKWVDVPDSMIVIGTSGNPTTPSFPRSIYTDAGLVGTGVNMGSLMTPSGASSTGAFKTMWAYQGFWHRPASNEIGWAAPGGSSAANHNEVGSIQPLAEVPVYTIKVLPSNVSQTWNLTGPEAIAHATTRDGRPNACHRYMTCQFNPIHDRLLLLGGRNWWEADHTWKPDVFRWQYGAADYAGAPNYGAVEPPIVFTPSGSTDTGLEMHTTDPATGIVYSVWGINVSTMRDPVTGVITQPIPGWSATPSYMLGLPGFQITQGNWCWWRRSNGHIGVFGLSGNSTTNDNIVFWMFNITTASWVPLAKASGTAGASSWYASMQSMFAGGIHQGYSPEGTAICYDPVKDDFLLYSEGEQTMYRLTTNWTNSMSMTPIAMTGTPPQLHTYPYGMYGRKLIHFPAQNVFAFPMYADEPIKVFRRS